MITGTIGTAPSASLGAGPHARGFGLYEPISGTAPDIAGRGIANPAAAILSAAMLARFSLGEDDAAWRIERAVAETLARGPLTADLIGEGAVSTSAFADVRRRRGSPRPCAPARLKPPTGARSPRTARTASDARDRCRAADTSSSAGTSRLRRGRRRRLRSRSRTRRSRAATTRRAPRAGCRRARRNVRRTAPAPSTRASSWKSRTPSLAATCARSSLSSAHAASASSSTAVDARQREIEHGLRVAAQAVGQMLPRFLGGERQDRREQHARRAEDFEQRGLRAAPARRVRRRRVQPVLERVAVERGQVFLVEALDREVGVVQPKARDSRRRLRARTRRARRAPAGRSAPCARAARSPPA